MQYIVAGFVANARDQSKAGKKMRISKELGKPAIEEVGRVDEATV